MNEPTPEDKTQHEIREEAVGEPDDPITKREELETELIDEGESAAGAGIGDQMP